ncbi:BrnT family toxin [Castellaniella caeni]|uniref:BrnT family toxin n=1 Tax=Castellaniella caeni TaxID=266123 RepID=UPI0009FE452E|nr:BrnT family toxin [Castellaniella caeni]
MEIEYDPAKNIRNIADRGLSFERVRDLDWNKTLVIQDRCKDYAEPRFQALGPIQGRLHVVIFTVRGVALRVISLRKANVREVAQYEKTGSRIIRCRQPGME